MRDWLRVLFTPGCWLQNECYSDHWDKRLGWMLDNDKHFTMIDAHYATIDGVVLWISNHPYASFRPTSLPDMRARRITILKAHDRLMEDATDPKNLKATVLAAEEKRFEEERACGREEMERAQARLRSAQEKILEHLRASGWEFFDDDQTIH